MKARTLTAKSCAKIKEKHKWIYRLKMATEGIARTAFDLITITEYRETHARNSFHTNMSEILKHLNTETDGQT